MLPDLHVCTQEDAVATQVVGWVLTVGTLVSFLPQIITLVLSKNLDGLSALTWMLNYLSNMMTIVNAVMLNWSEIQCCEELPFGQCVENLVPLVQLAVPVFCTFLIFALTTLYSGRMTDKEKEREAELRTNRRRSVADFFDFLFGTNGFIVPLFFASLVLTAITAGVGAMLMIFLGINDNATILYADIAGVLAVIFLMVMYIPQLYTTYKVKHTGSLSLVTLLIQAPGSMAVVYFDAVQSGLSWTTWAPYFVSGVQQFVLIGMCIYYHFRNKKIAESGTSGKIEKGETDPLLKTDPKKRINY